MQILDRDYRLSCEPAERDTLLAAVARVDSSMRTIREQGRIVGTERIAVFAALNLAGVLLAREADAVGDAPTSGGPVEAAARDPVAEDAILRRMQSIHALLDMALVEQDR